MSSLMQFASGRVKRRQIFTSSGTFTPSSRLLELGGWVEVLCVGGGGGGWRSSDNNVRHGGGGGAVVKRVVQVTGDVTVTIGAGGAYGVDPADNGSPGGSTSFGSLVTAAGGRNGSRWEGGVNDWYSYSNSAGGAGAGGFASAVPIRAGRAGFGGPGVYGYGYGGNGTSNAGAYGPPASDAPANSGGGGHCGGNGGSGIVIVEWWE